MLRTILMTAAILAALLSGGNAMGDAWKQLPALPDHEGFAGAFAGVSGGALIVAGGANFPDKKPWEGGKKIWYDTLFVLERPDGEWVRAGKLPRPLGYGVSVTHRDALICVGGSDAERHYADAFRIEWKAGKVVTTPLPPLPKAIANGCGALVGDRLYVAGGQVTPDATAALDEVFELDLAAVEPRWRAVEKCPGGARILAVAAGFDGDFWLIGGAALAAGQDGRVERRYLKDAWRYRDGGGWTRVADLPHAVVAAPSPAPSDQRGILVLGGDDGSQVGLNPPERHPGFPGTVLRYDAAGRTWEAAGKMPAPRVTAPTARWHDMWIIPSGEARPGIRSPQVWGLTLTDKE